MIENSKKAVEFLMKWKKSGPWVLTAIQTDKKAITTTTLKTKEEAVSWVNDFNGRRNIYFHVNSTIKDMNSKAQKEHIKSADWLHIDIDPQEGMDLDIERERALSLLTDKLPKGVPSPTVIVFSGGGYQGFWKLKNPVLLDGDVKQAEEFERYNKRLEQIFGGDHCHNVDRIMRLPGTINIPDAKKKRAGRTEELSVCVEFNKKSYDIDEFKKSQQVQMEGGVGVQGGSSSVSGPSVTVSGNIEKVMELSELDEWSVPDRVKIIIAQGRHPEKPKEGDNSRSAWVFDCLCQLYRCGVPDDIIYALITDPEWGISESVREQKNIEKYALRQMTRAKEHTEDPHLRFMNERHAIIGNIGGKCRVIEEVEDDVLGRSRLTVSSFEDIRNRYSNIMVEVGTNKQGEPIKTPLGKYWVNHVKRRQFDYMRFMPQGDKAGVYNLWRGFSVEPRPGDCSIYLQHLKENICCGNEEYYDYFIKWMARAVQMPASPGEVAVVLRGGKGVGKSLVAKIFGKLFGRHHLHIANSSHLVGNFNAHLRDVISLFADEAFFAGDKKHESVLKMLVTEDSIPIEQKGLDVDIYPNYVHLIMAANDPHVIRASGDERRYFVLEVSNKKKQDKKFFGSLIKQMDNGGLEALLMHLQTIDISDFQVRDVPQTEALREQKLLSMSVEEEWWYNKLQNGKVLENDSEWGDCSTDAVISDFTAHAEKWKISRRGNETTLGKFLSRVCPHLRRKQRRVTTDVYLEGDTRPTRKAKRIYMYEFGTLRQCRDIWESLNGKTEWLVEDFEPLIDIKEPF